MPSSASTGPPPALLSFPTRRSSDLLRGRERLIAKELSYGDQRRLEVARALATQPKLVLLDEPTAGMNPQETAAFTAFVEKLRREEKRSEEHTSELQSHVNLVCRLLLPPAPPQLYSLSLHDALPISCAAASG